MNCKHCIANIQPNENPMATRPKVQVPRHPEADRQGYVYLCTLMREKGECPLMIQRDARLIELQTALLLEHNASTVSVQSAWLPDCLPISHAQGDKG